MYPVNEFSVKKEKTFWILSFLIHILVYQLSAGSACYLLSRVIVRDVELLL
jgi:hypothetical protein